MGIPFADRDDGAMLRELVARESIRDCLYRFSRGLDRRDAEVLEAIHWPDATIAFGGFSGSPKEFVELVFSFFGTGGVGTTVHSIENILLRIDGDTAFGETYAQAYHRVTSAAGLTHEGILHGRYQDRFEQRDGEWRIAHRSIVFDHFRLHPDSGDWATGAMGVSAANARIAEHGSEGFDEFTRLLR